MSLISILLIGGVILLIIGIIAHCLLPYETDPGAWDIGPHPNAWAIVSYVSAFIFLLMGFSGLLCSGSCSCPPSTPKPRKVELVIPGDAQMNAEIIRKNARIHLKNL